MGRFNGYIYLYLLIYHLRQIKQKLVSETMCHLANVESPSYAQSRITSHCVHEGPQFQDFLQFFLSNDRQADNKTSAHKTSKRSSNYCHKNKAEVHLRVLKENNYCIISSHRKLLAFTLHIRMCTVHDLFRIHSIFYLFKYRFFTIRLI